MRGGPVASYGRRRTLLAQTDETMRPAPLPLVLAAVAVALAGCDAQLPEPPPGTCASVGLEEAGSVSATTPAGPFETACASVVSRGGTVLVLARATGAGPAGGETIELTVAGLEVGTYALGEGREAGAAYGPNLSARVAARSGSLTVTSVEGGIAGSFEFVTLSGAEVTGGRFDLDL